MYYFNYKLGEKVPGKGTLTRCQWMPCQKLYFATQPTRSEYCCDKHRYENDKVDKKIERRELSASILKFKQNYRILKRMHPECKDGTIFPYQKLVDAGFNLEAACVMTNDDTYFYGPYGVSFFRDGDFTIIKKDPDTIEQWRKF